MSARRLLGFSVGFALPYAICRLLGWDADLGTISGGFPTDVQIVHAGLYTLARLSEVLVAPVFGLAAGWRVLLQAAARWTGSPQGHTLAP